MEKRKGMFRPHKRVCMSETAARFNIPTTQTHRKLETGKFSFLLTSDSRSSHPRALRMALRFVWAVLAGSSRSGWFGGDFRDQREGCPSPKSQIPLGSRAAEARRRARGPAGLWLNSRSRAAVDRKIEKKTEKNENSIFPCEK